MTTGCGHPRRGAILAAATVIAIGMSTGAAMAAPTTNHSDNGRHAGESTATAPTPPASKTQHAAATGTSKASGKPSGTHSTRQSTRQRNTAARPASSTSPASQAQRNATGTTATSAPAATADPAGNNGTVKIAELGDLDRIPNNTPHPGCSYEVQWYGFDGGSDVVSTVSFTPQAPTSGATIGVDGPIHVPVGGDPASGAGTATGLDAVATYQLAFSGAAPAHQGYHVRLTVATPHSLGNDTKTKVFWVEPCEVTASARSMALPAAAPAVLGPLEAPTPPTSVGLSGPSTLPAGTPLPARMPNSAAPATNSSSTHVPTMIDAGQRHLLAAGLAGSRWALDALGLGALITLGGLVVGARRRA